MSQLGMTLPGGRGAGRPTANVYTAMLVVATVCLAGACAFVYIAGTKVSPDGKPWELQDANRIQLPAAD